MKAEKWIILGALVCVVGLAISKQLRLTRHRDESTDDIPDDVPTIQAAAEGRVPRPSQLDEQIAPGAPL